MSQSEQALRQLMSRQRGCCTRLQAMELGLDARSLGRRIASGRLVQVFPRVVAEPALAYSPACRSMAALLQCGTGAVLSHGTAGVLWKLDVVPPSDVHVTMPLRGRARAVEGLVVHGSAFLPGSDRVVFDQLPLTSVHRTILDLAPTLPAAAFERMVDDALTRGLTSPSRLEAAYRRNPRRNGSPALMERLAEWSGAESPAEEEVGTWLLGQGLARPVRQHEVAAGGRRYRLDFAWPEQLVALEVDGFRYHDGPERFREDRRRSNWLAARGWHVLHTTAAEVRGGGADLAAALRRLVGS
jgi:very-short-patch-repair endonuclease